MIESRVWARLVFLAGSENVPWSSGPRWRMESRIRFINATPAIPHIIYSKIPNESALISDRKAKFTGTAQNSCLDAQPVIQRSAVGAWNNRSVPPQHVNLDRKSVV